MKHFRVFPFVIIISCLVLLGCSSSELGAAPTPEKGGAQDIEAIISATGLVVPEQWAVLSARGQAVVVELLVKEGERVSAGQLLLRLDGQDAAHAKLSEAKYELTNAQQALETLQENSSAETARAQQAVAIAMQALHEAEEDVTKLDYRRASDDLITQTQDEIDLAKRQISRAEDVYRRVKNRPEGDPLKAEAELALVKARTYLDNRVSYLNWYTGKPDDIDSAKYRAALAVAQADLSQAQAQFERRKDGPDTNLLVQAEARLALAKAQVRAAEEVLATLELRAPFDGVVCNLEARIGEWVSPGMPLLQLGQLDRLQVRTTDLSEIDAARVHPQDQVLVTFDALPDVVVKGTVEWVANKSAEGSGVNYTVVIKLNNIPGGLHWGMTAFADIEAGQ